MLCDLWLQDSRYVCCRFASLNDDDNDDDDDAGSVVSHAQTDDDISGPSIEEIDAAVREVSADLPHSCIRTRNLWLISRPPPPSLPPAALICTRSPSWLPPLHPLPHVLIVFGVD